MDEIVGDIAFGCDYISEGGGAYIRRHRALTFSQAITCTKIYFYNHTYSHTHALHPTATHTGCLHKSSLPTPTL